MAVSAAVTAAVGSQAGYYDRQPMWREDEPDPVDALLHPDTHPARFHNSFKMNRECFDALLELIGPAFDRSQQEMSHRKRLAICLIYFAQDDSQRGEQERVRVCRVPSELSQWFSL